MNNIVIKTFKTPCGNYVYDRETNSIISVSKEDYDVLCRVEKGEILVQDFQVLNRYREKGYFKNSKLEMIEHPENSRLEFYLESRIEQVTLQVTQNCNLRCAYCAYSGKYNQRSHTNRVMSFETMKRSVDFAIKHSYGIEKLNIGFYGGEPLLEIQNIKKIIEYIKQEYPGKKIDYTLTTNGTIFSEENIHFLMENNFKVMVSLDGPKELHDENRVFSNGIGSFDKIMDNLEYIRVTYPEFFKDISFNTVVAPKSDYKCINDFFDATEIIDNNMLSRSTVSEYNIKDDVIYDDKFFITYGVQNLKILLSKIGLYDKEKISKLFAHDFLFTLRFYKELGNVSEFPIAAHPGGPCIPGARRPMIDVDGNIYPCERVSESSENMRIGNIQTGFDIEKVRKLLNIGKITENQCLKCWNFINCGLCAASADDLDELSRKKRLSFCFDSKLNTLNKMKEICFLKENDYDFREE